jgi:hypothetical protein
MDFKMASNPVYRVGPTVSTWVVPVEQANGTWSSSTEHTSGSWIPFFEQPNGAWVTSNTGFDRSAVIFCEDLLTRVSTLSTSEIESEGYLELEAALDEMVALDTDEDWRIEPAIYSTSCYIAAWLMDKSCPAPRVFNHGPKSVVFNWINDSNNSYLTISAEGLSTLVSSSDGIKLRKDYAAQEVLNIETVLLLANTSLDWVTVVHSNRTNSTSALGE